MLHVPYSLRFPSSFIFFFFFSSSTLYFPIISSLFLSSPSPLLLIFSLPPLSTSLLLLFSFSHQGNNTPHKAKVVQVFWVYTGGGVDLQGVVVGGILEETVHRVENLMRQQEKPLTAWRMGRVEKER